MSEGTFSHIDAHFIFWYIKGPMDYQKNIQILDYMANQYVNSSVVMYGLVANWIPVYKFYVEFKNVFRANISINAGLFVCFIRV